VELRGGGELAGRVHWGGTIPTRLYMLVLEHRTEADGFVEMFDMPRFGLTGLEGEFRISNLPPGTHEVELIERFLDQDPLGMIGREDFEPASLYSQEIEIRDGETTELVIDLTPTGRGATARVVGHVRVFGRNLAGADVRVRGNESVRVKTDERGRFETEAFSIRESTWITIQGDVSIDGGTARRVELYSESVELENDDVHEIALDLHPLTVRVEVLDAASGAPLAEAEVEAHTTQEGQRSRAYPAPTDTDGKVELLVLEPGDYALSAEADGYGRASAQVSVPAEGLTATTTLRLTRSVPCSGRVALAPGDVGTDGPGFAYVQVHGKENGVSSGAMLRAPDYTFELEGLAPGEYTHWIFLNGRRGEQGTFVLGPDGESELVLTFVPSLEVDED
jgi:5-hydroxyisourate hydrolase-like protein (transthyretin family)